MEAVLIILAIGAAVTAPVVASLLLAKRILKHSEPAGERELGQPETEPVTVPKRPLFVRIGKDGWSFVDGDGHEYRSNDDGYVWHRAPDWRRADLETEMWLDDELDAWKLRQKWGGS